MRTALRLALLLSVTLAALAPARAAADDGEFDAVHHTADGYYLDFMPFGKVELPRLFVTRRDGAVGFDVFGSSTAAVASGRYMIESHGEGGHAEGEAHGSDTERRRERAWSGATTPC